MRHCSCIVLLLFVVGSSVYGDNDNTTNDASTSRSEGTFGRFNCCNKEADQLNPGPGVCFKLSQPFVLIYVLFEFSSSAERYFPFFFQSTTVYLGYKFERRNFTLNHLVFFQISLLQNVHHSGHNGVTNNETVVMLVSQTGPVRVYELFCYVNVFLYSSKFAQILAT